MPESVEYYEFKLEQAKARHRRDLDRSWNLLGKSVELSDKAESHENKAAYWESKAKHYLFFISPHLHIFFEYLNFLIPIYFCHISVLR